MNYDDYKLEAPPEGKPFEETEKPFNLDAAIRFWDNLDIDRLHDINCLKLD